MKLLVGHNEAFYYAYRARPLGVPRVTLPPVDACSVVTRTADIVAAAPFLARASVLKPSAGVPGTLLGPDAGKSHGAGLHHVLVPSSCSRRSNGVAMRYRWSANLPKGAFVQVEDGIYVSSPEFAWLQLAGRLSTVRLVRAGCALCSAYRIDEATGAILACGPATTPERLTSFVRAADGSYGVQRARAALPYVVAGAASPGEVAAFALTCLPEKLGGMGAPVARLNYRIQVRNTDDVRVADRPDRNWYCVDMGWPQMGCGVEYLGKYHEEQAHADRERINALLAMGERVLQVRHSDLSRPELLARYTAQLCALLGMQPPRETPAFLMARDALLREFFGPLSPPL